MKEKSERFGRSNPVTCTAGLRSPMSRTMSSRTRRVAVAVAATTGGRTGRLATKSAMPWYAGRKSCPHWLTQCASSTATSGTRTPAANARKRWSARRSGATYMRSYQPWEARAITTSCWRGVSVELR